MHTRKTAILALGFLTLLSGLVAPAWPLSLSDLSNKDAVAGLRRRWRKARRRR